jgi:hypothetical protein
MANVNYIYERESFVRHARENRYTGDEILLWNALFTIFNERAMRNGQVWPDGFIRITNKELLSWLPYGESTLNRARGTLVNPTQHQPTLVDYVKGKRNTDIPQYRMRWFSITDGRYTSSCYLQNEGNMSGNASGNVHVNMSGNMQGNPLGNMGDINTKRIPDEYGIPETEIPLDDEDETDAYASATETVRECFGLYFGREANPAEAEAIAKAAVQNGITTPSLIRRVMRTAAENAPRTPSAYVETLCREWGKKIKQWERDGYPEPTAAEC